MSGLDVAVELGAGGASGFTLRRDRVLEMGRMITTCSHLTAGNLGAQLVPGKLKQLRAGEYQWLGKGVPGSEDRKLIVLQMITAPGGVTHGSGQMDGISGPVQAWVRFLVSPVGSGSSNVR